MINFVVCDDKKEYLNEISKIIDKIMMKNKYLYKKNLFSEYNNEFIDMVNDNNIKIYILDIEVSSKSGLDMARLIRKQDFNSIIIFLTSHSNEGFTVLKGDFMALSFISKFDNYKQNLMKSLSKAIEIVIENKNLKFVEKGIYYSIPYSNILYINRSVIERKCCVKTTDNVFKSSLTFNDFTNSIEYPFLKVNKSCFINVNRILKICTRTKEVHFDNGSKAKIYSNLYKEVVNEYISK